MSPWVSVVVPTCRRPALLDRCLTALAQQDFDPRAFDIIVADDAGDVETRCLVQRHVATGLPARHVAVCGRHGPAAARNVGWRAARGGIIAFIDDDCLARPEWLRAGVAAFVNGTVAAAGRVVVPLPLDSAPTDYERNAALLQHAPFVTANCFFQRDTLERLGGFDERFALAWREDSDLMARVKEAGQPIANAPDAVVAHPVRPAHWGVSLGQQRKSMYNALLYKKHPEFYRREIQRNPPWRYYATVAAALTGLASSIAGHRRLAFAAGLAWSMLTARFAGARLSGTSHTPAHVVEMIVTSALIPPLAVFWRLRGAVKFRVWFL